MRWIRRQLTSHIKGLTPGDAFFELVEDPGETFKIGQTDEVIYDQQDNVRPEQGKDDDDRGMGADGSGFLAKRTS